MQPTLKSFAGWYFKKDIEDFLNAISFIFPPGEKFFIHSVQNYQDRITDPVLKDEVKRFIYQEAMHTKEHARCNLALIEAHPNGGKIETFAAACLSLITRFTPKASQLACTSALEHFTAILADELLRNQEVFLSETDPAFAALWLWHAVEESEHKAVCFDVYQTIAGKGVLSYLHRVIVMFLITLLFIFTLFYAVKQIRKGEKTADAQPATGEAGAGQTAPVATRKPGLRDLPKILSLRLYFDYYRPSFHPWDHNNVDLIEEWKHRYRDFGAGPDAAMSDAMGDAKA
jgi:predicted metal-dependent hydrolase